MRRHRRDQRSLCHRQVTLGDWGLMVRWRQRSFAMSKVFCAGRVPSAPETTRASLCSRHTGVPYLNPNLLRFQLRPQLRLPGLQLRAILVGRSEIRLSEY